MIGEGQHMVSVRAAVAILLAENVNPNKKPYRTESGRTFLLYNKLAKHYFNLQDKFVSNMQLASPEYIDNDVYHITDK